MAFSCIFKSTRRYPLSTVDKKLCSKLCWTRDEGRYSGGLVVVLLQRALCLIKFSSFRFVVGVPDESKWRMNCRCWKRKSSDWDEWCVFTRSETHQVALLNSEWNYNLTTTVFHDKAPTVAASFLCQAIPMYQLQHPVLPSVVAAKEAVEEVTNNNNNRGRRRKGDSFQRRIYWRVSKNL